MSSSHLLKLRIQNICCAKETVLITNNLKDVQGISKVTVNAIGRQAYIHHDENVITAVEIIERLNTLHLGVSVIEKGEEQESKVKLKTKLTIIYKICNLVLLTVLFIAVLCVNAKSTTGRWIAIPLLILGGLPLLWKTLLDFRRCVILNVNLLMLLAVLGTILVNELLDSIVIVYAFGIAELLERGCRYKVEKDISELMHSSPEKAVLAETNETVDVENVPIGTLILVCAGERIPLDGDVISGKCSVDESSITGESTPLSKTTGDTVFSGSIIQSGFLKIKTSSDHNNSTSSRIKQLVEEAQSQSTKKAELINKFVKYFAPGIILVAGLMVLVPLILWQKGDMTRNKFDVWCIRGLTVLLVACPCSIIMATPVPMICGITKAAKLGVLVKGGIYLERLAEVTLMIFDKTGTLTEGKFQVIQEHCTDQDNYNEILELAAALETKSAHPLAACVVNHYSGCITDKIDNFGKAIALPEVQKFKNHSGLGLSGQVKDHDLLVGSKKFMVENDLEITDEVNHLADMWTTDGYTLIFVAVDLKKKDTSQDVDVKNQEKGTSQDVDVNDQISLLLGLADKCRSSSTSAIYMLQNAKIRCVMLTGDTQGPAERIRKQVGLQSCHSSMKPNEKYQWIYDHLKTKVEKKKPVIAMVGDGINDCPSLALADVGIAIGPSAAALAIQSADLSLMTDNMMKIPDLINLSKHCRSVVLQNIFLAIFIKVCFVIAALFYDDALWLAVLADMLGLLSVSANGIRPLYWKPKVDSQVIMSVEENTDEKMVLVDVREPNTSYGSI